MMKKTLIAVTLATSMVSGSAIAWTAGDFSGSFDIGGTIEPASASTSWKWMLGDSANDAIHFNISQGVADQVNNTTSWDGLVKKAIPVLSGKTVSRTPGKVGLSPVITYGGEGFTIDKSSPVQSPVITLAAKGVTDPTRIGTFKFSLSMLGLAAEDNNGTKVLRVLIADGDTYGNGYGQRVDIPVPQVKNIIAAQLGSEMIDTTSYSPGETTSPYIFFSGKSVEGVYASEIVATSGVVTFPTATIPTDWKSSMTVSVSYL